MKTFLSVLFVVCVAQSVVAAETIGTLRSIRWHALSMSGISTNGTALIDTTTVDSFAVLNDQTVATDFALTSYSTNEKLDTFVTTGTDPANRTQQDTLNTDFITGQLLWAIRKAVGQEQFYAIGVGLPPLGEAKPTPESQLSTVWTGAGRLFYQPVTSSRDTVIICYRALPAKMTSVNDTTEVDPALRRMIVILTAADIAKRRNNTVREAVLRAEYETFKAQRLVLPAAALSGGDN